MKRFIYTATATASTDQLGYSVRDNSGRIWYGAFKEGKAYVVTPTDGPEFSISGFFIMFTPSNKTFKIRGNKSKVKKYKKEGLGYWTLNFKKEIATKFLKYTETIFVKSRSNKF